jgi:putative chitinase
MTPDDLIAATGCRAAQAAQFAPLINEACAKYGINTVQRRAYFVAQMAVESGMFARLTESLYYTTAQRLIDVWPSRFRAPANTTEAGQRVYADRLRNPDFYLHNEQLLAEFVYGGRMGNGPEGVGDGYAYRGRGLKQLTGKDAYASYQRSSLVGVLEHPELVAEPAIAADSAGWVWVQKGGNTFADTGDVRGLTRAINGGYTGLAQRQQLTMRALSVATL